MRQLLTLPTQSTGTTMGIRAQWVSERDTFKDIGKYVGRVAKAFEWIVRLVFGFCGFAVVGAKWRRPTMWALSAALSV